MGFRNYIEIAHDNHSLSFISKIQPLIHSERLCSDYQIRNGENVSDKGIVEIVNKNTGKVLCTIYEKGILGYHQLYFGKVSYFDRPIPDIASENLYDLIKYINTFE